MRQRRAHLGRSWPEKVLDGQETLPSYPINAYEPLAPSLIVRLIAGLNPDEQQQVIARNGGVETSSMPVLRLHVVEAPSATIAETMQRFQSDPQLAPDLFGKGPFRWALYRGQRGKLLAHSAPFYLSTSAGETVKIEVSLAP